jgi:transcription termination factor Rho
MTVESPTIERSELEGKLLPELQRIAQSLGVPGSQRLRKGDLISAIVTKSSDASDGPPATSTTDAGNGTGGSERVAVRSVPNVPDAVAHDGSSEDPGNGRASGTATTAGPSATDAPAVGEGSPDAGGLGGHRGSAGSDRASGPTEAGTAEPRTEGNAREGSGREQDGRDDPRDDGTSRERGNGGDGGNASSGPRQREGGERGPRGDGQRSDRNRGDQRGDRQQGQGGQGQGAQGQGAQGQGQGAQGQRDRRPSREERRRQREERRVREQDEREEELATAPSRKGILDVLPEGYGFLRTNGYLPGPDDVYVSLSQVRRFALRRGDQVEGPIRQPRDSEKYYALLRIDGVNGVDADTARGRPDFDKLTPLFPEERYRLEHAPLGIAERIIDLVAPVGKGQRGMVVSPPKAGKTTVLKQIAGGILAADPETHVIILLVDERPEEVTDWQRTVPASEVVYSTFDKPADQHTQVTELVLDRAKRLVEQGRDVVILLDSITRLARAYNLAAPASGRILSGGVDSTALYPPKRFFGAARNLEEGGSLTIIASALVETGSRMDEVIFEEFKGTGNWEIRLDRQLSEKRIFPSINIEASGTRKEERLMTNEELVLVWRLRRVLHALDSGAALELLIDKIRQTKSNEQFLREISKAPTGD